jgi:hypothetical protein
LIKTEKAFAKEGGRIRIEQICVVLLATLLFSTSIASAAYRHHHYRHHHYYRYGHWGAGPLRLRVSKAISTKAIDEMATQTGPWPRLRFPSSSVRTEESCLSGSNERGALQSELCEPPPALIEKHI